MACFTFQILPLPSPGLSTLTSTSYVGTSSLNTQISTFIWAKHIQAPEKAHVVELPVIRDSVLCPVATLQALLNKLALSPDQPLFVLDNFTLITQSMLHKRLATFFRMMDLPLLGYGSNTFRRSGATIAYDAEISAASIQMHGAW